jgi:hypothetical protein
MASTGPIDQLELVAKSDLAGWRTPCEAGPSCVRLPFAGFAKGGFLTSSCRIADDEY